MKESVMEAALNVTSQTWDQEVLKSPDAVMVDFWAVWCGPCRALAPVVEDLAKEYTGRLNVRKLNTDENVDIASQYQIMGIPTLLFFKNGQVVDKVVGVAPRNQLKEKIEGVLAKK